MSRDYLLIHFKGDDEITKEHLKAYHDYQKRKNEMITKLYTIWKNPDIPSVYRQWIRQAAKFINEKEV